MQAYTNLVLALLDASDSAVLFCPFYFNHAMALQMTGCDVVYGKVCLGATCVNAGVHAFICVYTHDENIRTYKGT